MNKAIKYYYNLRRRITTKSWGEAYFEALQEYVTGKKWKEENRPEFLNKISGECSYLATDKSKYKKLYRDFRIKNILFGIAGGEYFARECFKKSIVECSYICSDFRTRWLNTMLNQKDKRKYLGDKALFAKHWCNYFGRRWCDEENSVKEFEETFQGVSRIIVKPKGGTMGRGIQILDIEGSLGDVFNMIKTQYPNKFIVEEYYNQTGFMHDMNPSSLNTIRVITVRDGKSGKIWPVSTFARVGIDGAVIDNYSAGGVTYNIDLETGMLCQGMSKASNGKPLKYHPGTEKSYSGLVIPKWHKVLDFCCKAHNIAPKGLDFIGWDVGLSENEMILVEGNSWPGFGRNTRKNDNQWKRVLPVLDGKTNPPE